MNESKSNEEKPNKKLRFSKEQYDMLKSCSEKNDVTEWNEWREVNPGEKIWLEDANLNGFFLDYVNLENAILNNAQLFEVYPSVKTKSMVF